MIQVFIVKLEKIKMNSREIFLNIHLNKNASENFTINIEKSFNITKGEEEQFQDSQQFSMNWKFFVN